MTSKFDFQVSELEFLEYMKRPPKNRAEFIKWADKLWETLRFCIEDSEHFIIAVEQANNYIRGKRVMMVIEPSKRRPR